MKDATLKTITLFLYFLTFQIAFGQGDIISNQQISSAFYLYERTDFEIQLAVSFENPFDANEIALDMIITSPSFKELSLPCFYISGDDDHSVWNARFLPQEIGDYSYHFQLSKSNEVVALTNTEEFTVLPSAKNGVFHVNDDWTFTFDSGMSFRGIGENIGWEARDWENQNYTYDYFLPKLASNGVNFFRTWTCIWNLPIEWQIVQDTRFYNSTTEYFNPEGIQRMDELIELIDSLDMHMMLALVPHGALITSGEWKNNPYNIVNGGPASTPTEFFTLEKSQKKFKNTLRYLVARWGYSPGIGVWEFCNEIDNAAYDGGNTLFIPEAAITNWHAEMSEYLTEIDIYDHPISTSISHRELQGLYNVPDIDFNQIHIYRNTGGIPGKINQYKEAYDKPFVVGEFGWDWDWNNVSTENGPDFDFDLKRGLWYGLFSSTPIVPMSWWWEFFDERDMTSYYKSVTTVSQKMLSAGNGDFKPATVSASGIEKYAVQCGSSYFIYLLNNSANNIESEVRLNVESDVTYYISSVHPSTNKDSTVPHILANSGTIDLGEVSLKTKEEIVFIVSPDQSLTGISNPYSGSVISLPGIIEAEEFDIGSDGLAFHDFDKGNSGGFYRENSDVDIYEKIVDFYVSDIVKGEWLNYSVNFQESGVYSVSAVASSNAIGTAFRLLLDGQPVTDEIEVPQAGNLESWQIIDVPLKNNLFRRGNSTLKIEFLGSDLSIDKIEFNLENKAPAIQLTAPNNDSSYDYPAQINIQSEVSDEDGEIAKVAFYNGAVLLGEVTALPYEWNWAPSVGAYQVFAIATDNSGLTATSDTIFGKVQVSHLIPGVIEAENYDVGSNGESYYDLTSGNKFAKYRTEDIDIESCSDEGGGFSLGDFQTGEWLNYTVQVEESGRYRVDFRVATNMDGGKLSISVDGQTINNSITIPNTGGWQIWETISVDGIQLEEGQHVIELGSVSEYVNVNNMMFSNVTTVKEIKKSEIYCFPNPVTSTLFISELPKDAGKMTILNNQGIPVRYIGKFEKNIDVINLSPGIYNLLILSKENNLLNLLRFVKY
ncbi:carbohydrate-binding protein [Sunxiuqinia sp. A32]|uniref:carbohydrate-binding protein n=1 Tax=Sunxiuqinia sp. A32 TaxID=3461496 RepID=UPI0040460913